MKWLFSFALALAVTDLAEAQTCTYDFCGGSLSNIPDPKKIANFAEDPAEQIDCETVLATSSFFPADGCESVLMAVEVLCCPDNAVQTCFLCGSDVTYNKDKELPDSDGMTCEFVNYQLALLQTDELCTGAMAEFGTLIDIPAYCECEGATPPNVCQLCDAGYEFDSTKVPPDGEGFTCGDGATLISYVSDASLCDELFGEEGKAECCVATDSPGTPTNSPGTPTNSPGTPTNSPGTADNSAGTCLYYSVSAFVIGWLAFAF